jgi:hypothetical protein
MIVQSPSCPRCPNTPKDRHHLFFACPAALTIWQTARLDHLLVQYPNTWCLPAATPLPN